MTKTHALRTLALGASVLALLSGPMASDALAIHAEDTPEWAAPEGFFVEPEAIFMQFADSDTDFAGVGNHDSSVDVGIDSDYEFGWRLGLGYRWSNRWSIGFRWTSIDEDESDWATPKGGGDLAFNYLTESHGDAVLGNIDRDLDIFDVEVSRTWGDLDGHHMRLFFGPRYMSYDQTLTATTFDEFGDPTDMGVSDFDIEAWGARVGIEGHVALGQETGWSFFGYAAASALATNSDASWAADHDYDGGYDEATGDDDDESSTGLEAGLGFQWSHTFDDWNFGIRFGWELSNYTDFVGGSTSSDGHASDDLGLNGGFVRFAFTF